MSSGIEIPQGGSFAFRNFLFSMDALAIKAHEGLTSPLFQFPFLSYLSSPRVPPRPWRSAEHMRMAHWPNLPRNRTKP